MFELRFSDLSEARRLFVRQCKQIGFGRIERLEVHAGEPEFGPDTESFIDMKLDSDEFPRPELRLDDFAVSVEIRRFFSKLETIRNGTVESIEIRAGIPRRFVLKTPDQIQKQ